MSEVRGQFFALLYELLFSDFCFLSSDFFLALSKLNSCFYAFGPKRMSVVRGPRSDLTLSFCRLEPESWASSFVF